MKIEEIITVLFTALGKVSLKQISMSIFVGGLIFVFYLVAEEVLRPILRETGVAIAPVVAKYVIALLN